MRAWLRRLFGGKRRDAPPPAGSGVAPPPRDDSELRRRITALEQQALAAIQQQRAAEAQMTPRERIKGRLNLPRELPADYGADGSIPLLAPARQADPGPSVVVVNNGGMGLQMPRALFEYLYRQRAPTADEQRVINNALEQWGLDPEAF